MNDVLRPVTEINPDAGDVGLLNGFSRDIMASSLPEVLALTRCKLVKRLRSKPSATASISASYKLGSGLARIALVKALVIWIWKPTELKLSIEIHCAPNDQDAEQRSKNHDSPTTVPGF